MASVSSRHAYPAPLALNAASQSQYRIPASLGSSSSQPTNHIGLFTSPTESEFSESHTDNHDGAQQWDEARVGEWLKSINCAQYVDLFRRNNINGENLMDMDQATLKEIGVKKIGDRVRLGTQVKVLRTSIYKRSSKRSHNRNSLAILDGHAQMIPLAAGSPRPLYSGRATGGPPRATDGRSPKYFDATVRPNSRPNSPFIEDPRVRPVRSLNGIQEPTRKDSLPQTSQPGSASGRLAAPSRIGDTPKTAGFGAGTRKMPSLNNLNTSNIIGALPADKPLIRVIYEKGSSSVVNIAGFKNAEDILRIALKAGGIFSESHMRAHCFWLLDGTIANPDACRRITEAELVRISNDGVRSERGRLILRKIHMSKPDGDQLRAAARIAEQQLPSPPLHEVKLPASIRSKLKLEQLTGQQLPSDSYTMSPTSIKMRDEYFDGELSRNPSQSTTASVRARKLKDFYGARPPTELITQDLQSYFPEVAKEDMDRTVRMSVHRSQRMSKALSRLSVTSAYSVYSVDQDVPPIPSVADAWYNNDPSASKSTLRPLSVVRLTQSRGNVRDSIASSVLERLDEENESNEPNRKSYVSMSGDSGSDGATQSNLSVTDPDGNTVMRSYYDDGNSSPPEGGSSLNSRLSQYIAEDGEESDEELMLHLEKSSWDDLKYMKGAMIGQGSFGTVFLALHAVTAELMAVKQVELPSTASSAIDTKKNNMIEALKHEISLLRELKHPNIVQYLGSNSDETHLNIFLEYVAGGSVATMLVNYGSLNEQLIRGFVRQILEGLNYLHSKDIIHRDIKGANILVDNKGTVKISDFGISKRVEASSLLNNPVKGRGGPRVSLQGSVFWMAPEVVRQTAYTKKADIWSLGCLIVEMFTGSHPHPNCTQLQALFKIGQSANNAENAKPDLPSDASKEAREFLAKTFEIEHEKRPTAAELLVSDFCTQKLA